MQKPAIPVYSKKKKGPARSTTMIIEPLRARSDSSALSPMKEDKQENRTSIGNYQLKKLLLKDFGKLDELKAMNED